jgi:hypothetical protein
MIILCFYELIKAHNILARANFRQNIYLVDKTLLCFWILSKKPILNNFDSKLALLIGVDSSKNLA